MDRMRQVSYGAVALLLAVFGWYAFLQDTRVPLLGSIDLAIHEFGHLWTRPFPELFSAIMGSGTQVLLPLLLAGVFLLKERNLLGTAFCVGWAGTSFQDASVYVADAPYQNLQLIGGYHDWAFVLAETDRLHQAAGIAKGVWLVGLLLWVLAVGLIVIGLAGGDQAVRDGAVHRWLARVLAPVFGRRSSSSRAVTSQAGEADKPARPGVPGTGSGPPADSSSAAPPTERVPPPTAGADDYFITIRPDPNVDQPATDDREHS